MTAGQRRTRLCFSRSTTRARHTAPQSRTAGIPVDQRATVVFGQVAEPDTADRQRETASAAPPPLPRECRRGVARDWPIWQRAFGQALAFSLPQGARRRAWLAAACRRHRCHPLWRSAGNNGSSCTPGTRRRPCTGRRALSRSSRRCQTATLRKVRPGLSDYSR